MSVQVCPVCQGRGVVPADFYELPNDTTTFVSGKFPVTCKACAGQGIVSEASIMGLGINTNVKHGTQI